MMLLKQTTPLEDFLPHVLAFAVGDEERGALPENVALSFIRNSAFAFADKTGVIRDKVWLDLQCGLDTYPIDVPSCETIVGVRSAKLGEFHSEDCGKRWSWGNVCFAFDDDESLTIHPPPNQDLQRGLELELILAPAKGACEVDSRLYDKWHDAIIHGALAEIHMMPGRPWSSVSRADYRRRLFNEEVSRAINRKVLNGKREPLQVQMNPDWFICNTAQRRW